jgi:hypothetical protein
MEKEFPMLVLTVSDTNCLEIVHQGEKLVIFFEDKVKVGIKADKAFDIKRIKLEKVDSK